ncbi:hypothetical protein ACTXT7_004356 [Hymenolepis weldensis]
MIGPLDCSKRACLRCSVLIDKFEWVLVCMFFNKSTLPTIFGDYPFGRRLALKAIERLYYVSVFKSVSQTASNMTGIRRKSLPKLAKFKILRCGFTSIVEVTELLSFIRTEPRLPSLTNQGSSHKPKIRYRGDQGFRTVHLSRRHPVQATVSAVDLSSTELSNTSPTPSIDNLTTLLQSSSRRRFPEPPDYYYYFHQNHNYHQRQNCHLGERFRREAAPNKTTSETNLDAAAIIPGFSGYGHFSQLHYVGITMEEQQLKLQSSRDVSANSNRDP